MPRQPSRKQLFKPRGLKLYEVMWNQFESSIRTIQGSQKPAEPNGLIPLRPILPVIGTCSYNLEKLFVPIIKEFTVNGYKVKDPPHFQMNLVTKRLTDLV